MAVGQAMRLDGDVENRQSVRNVSKVIMCQIHLLVHESERRTLHPKLAVASI
jgi:hypothetical protein